MLDGHAREASYSHASVIPGAAGDSYVRAIALTGFEQAVAAAGGEPAALLERAGIAAASLAEPDTLVSHRRFTSLLELAAKSLARPSFGLDWAQSQPAHCPNLGPLLLLARFDKTVRGWLRSVTRYWSFHTNGASVKLLHEPGSDRAILRYALESYAPSGRQVTEHTIASFLMAARQVVGHPDLQPTLVRFQHGRPTDLASHNAAFGCPVEFDAAHTEIVFAAEWLDMPLDDDLDLFKKVMSHHIRQRIDRMGVYDQSMKTTVALAIPSLLGSGRCSIGAIADSLGINVKKLQRLLIGEGTTFSAILEEVREAIGRRLLAETSAPVSRVAGLLDYSTTAPFTQAFKRWTGKSPLAYRATARGRRK